MANTVPYWGYYSQGSFDYNPADTGPGRQFLEALRKIDPNATFVSSTGGGGEGGSGQTSWTLNTSAAFPGVDLNQGEFDPQYYNPRDAGGFQPNGHSFDMSQLIDPNATKQSDVFGSYTSQNNIKPQAATLLDYLGPAAVGAFGLAMGGIPALYQGVFGQGAYGAGDALAPGAGDFWGAGANGTASYGGVGGGATVDPWDVMGDPTAYGLSPQTQAAAPIVDRGTQAGIIDTIRNGGMPTLGQLGSVARTAGSVLGKVPGLMGTPGGGGGGLISTGSGGGGLFGGENATDVIRRFYGEDAISKLKRKASNG